MAGNSYLTGGPVSAAPVESVPAATPPMVVTGTETTLHLREWLGFNQDKINAWLLEHGAVLFREFRALSVNELAEVATVNGGESLKYIYRSTARSEVEDRVFTSTEYPRDLEIPQHNENSYTTTWPSKIWFYCDQDGFTGGETPMSDSRKVFQRIPPDIRSKFEEKELIYERNYNDVIDLPWQVVFQTESRQSVEDFCKNNQIQYEWRNDGSLTTRQKCPAVIQHAITGEFVWFNQAHLFHHSSADRDLKVMLEEIGSRLPRNVYFGDGSEIPHEDIEVIRQVYKELQTCFEWKHGDLLVLDNVLTAHGRRPFSGRRRILVVMTS